VTPVLSAEEVRAAQIVARATHVDPKVQRYIVDLVTATRDHEQVEVGASPRGSIALLHATQAYAAMQGRNFVLPDDIKRLAAPVLAHRLVLTPEARAREVSDVAVVQDLLNRIPVPVGVTK
jgi:MoxR-like ATPase